MAAILDESGAAILDEGSADLYDEAGSSSGPARYVLTADVTIPWPAVWSEVIQGAAAPQVATPSFPASGSPIINATGITVAATIAGGTVTAVTVNGAQSGASDGTYLVSPAAVIAVTYTGSPSWSWTAAQLPQSGTSSMTASVAAAAPPGGQAGTIPQSTFLAGTPLWLDPSAELFAAIGSGNLMAWRDGTDSVGHSGISNLPGALMSKITDYGALSSTETDDVLPIVDVHDTTMAPAGTTKKITVANLLASAAPLASPALTGTPTAPTAAAGDASTQVATDAFVAASAAYFLRVFAV